MQDEKILILTKTYPNPSKKYQETTCVAGVSEHGKLTRIYPVRYRFLQDEQQFKKWQWIEGKLSKSTADNRPESRKVDSDSIRLGDVIDTQNNWSKRLKWIEPHILPSFSSLEERRLNTGETLGFLRPSRLISLEVVPLPKDERDWTDDEKEKLTRDLQQPGLFDDANKPTISILRKIPYSFYYKYEIETLDGPEVKRHMITDWEAGALFWNCYKSHGEMWEKPFREKLEAGFQKKDMILMMGNMHLHQHQWLIIGLVYPPKIPQVILAL
jgi:hypothetical protein